jgi:hypothetical protein
MVELYQCGIGLAPFPRGQVSEPIRTDRNAYQPQGWKAYGRGHAPHLTVATLGDGELDP